MVLLHYLLSKHHRLSLLRRNQSFPEVLQNLGFFAADCTFVLVLFQTVEVTQIMVDLDCFGFIHQIGELEDGLGLNTSFQSFAKFFEIVELLSLKGKLAVEDLVN